MTGHVRTTVVRGRLGAVGCALLLACAVEREPKESAESAVPEPPPLAGEVIPVPSDTVHAFEGTWDLDTVEERLRAVGLTPDRDPTRVEQPFMSVAATLYRIDGGELQAYLYADAGARARDTDRLDTLRVAPRTSIVDWRQPPTLIVSNNLAAILLTDDASLRERVRAALRPGGQSPEPGARPLR